MSRGQPSTLAPEERAARRAARRRAARRRRLTALAVLLLLAAGAAVGVVQATGGTGRRPEPAAHEAARREAAVAVTSPAREERRAAPAGSTVTVAVVGDVVMGTTGNLPPDGGRTFFDAVDQDLRGDVVLGNLEGTLSTGSSSKCGAGSTSCYAFQMPPSYARWLKRAGFTILNLANNHAYDYGAAGFAQTQRALRRHGLAVTGPPGRIAALQAGKARVALLGFASYPWANDLTDLRAARRLVAKAAGLADLVVVMFHGGAEGADRTHVPHGTETYLGENRGNLRAFSHAVVEAGADLVVGSGPHVLRGMEWYRGRLIAYSLGNFAGYEVFSVGGSLGVGGILRVTLRADGRYVKGLLVPTALTREGLPVLDAAERAHGMVRTLSRQDFGRRGARITTAGAVLGPR